MTDEIRNDSRLVFSDASRKVSLFSISSLFPPGHH